MFGGELALVLGLIVGSFSSSTHVLIGVTPSVEFEVRLDGVELSSSPVLADSLGILGFTIEVEGPGTVSIRSVELGQPGLQCGESER